MNTAITVRKAEQADAQALSELFLAFTGQPSDCTAMQKQLSLLSNNPHYYVAAACDGNNVIGTAMGILCMDLVGNGNPYMLVENVVVLDTARGKGVGKRLMHELENWAQRSCCNYVLLVSGAQRTEAHRFYESIGYERQTGYKKRLASQI